MELFGELLRALLDLINVWPGKGSTLEDVACTARVDEAGATDDAEGR